jgi:hypothetical protein
MNISYIIDRKGNRKSVIISKKEWNCFCDEFEKTKYKLNVLLGIQEDRKEVKPLQRHKK